MPRGREGNQEEDAGGARGDIGVRTRSPVAIRLGGAREGGRGRGSFRKDALLGGRIEVASARGVRGPDRVLLEALGCGLEGRVLVAGGREGLAAIAAARLFPGARVELFSMDAYEARRARDALSANGAGAVRVVLGADIPRDEPHDWVLLPVPRTGDAMLAGELVREAHDALAPGGKLLAASDNPKDRWLHDRVLEVFGSATIHLRGKHGVAYIARRRAGHEPRARDFRRSFRARLLGQDLELETRPGIFSHGELDDGARAVAEAASASLREDSRVIDLGCGSGALGIAAALAAPRGLALLADSQPRSARAARSNALRNGAGRNTLVILADDLASVREGSFDLLLANPPYYADHRITEHFAREGFRALGPGGEILVVTKSPGRAAEIVARVFGNHSSEERRGYSVVRGVKKGRPPRARGG